MLWVFIRNCRHVMGSVDMETRPIRHCCIVIAAKCIAVSGISIYCVKWALYILGADKLGRPVIVFSACRLPPTYQILHTNLLGCVGANILILSLWLCYDNKQSTLAVWPLKMWPCVRLDTCVHTCGMFIACAGILCQCTRANVPMPMYPCQCAHANVPMPMYPCQCACAGLNGMIHCGWHRTSHFNVEAQGARWRYWIVSIN